MLDPAVFKAYDIRGLYGSELDEEGAYRVGRAYAEHFEPRSIAVGRDMRLSSPAMAAAVIEGAADGGVDVLDIGLVGTEMVYHAVGELSLDGGICITASHNPAEYTGMKIVRRGALPVGGDSGLLDIRARAEAEFGAVVRRGSVREEDVWPGFVEKVLSFVEVNAIGPLRVVVDAANGMGGAMLPPSSSGFRSWTSSAASSSRTGPSRTTSRTRCCRRTASSSCARRSKSARTSESRSTAMPTAASSSTTPASSCPETSSPRSSPRRSSRRSAAGR